VATFLLSQTLLGLFHSLLEFQETVHDLREGIGTFFPAIAVVFLSYSCLSSETLLKSSIFLVLTALTVCAPMLLAQRTAFLDSHLFGDSDLVGTSTLAVTFVALSGSFLELSLVAFSLALEFE
jgi:hypothetical protein